MLVAKKLRTAFLFLPFVFCLSLSGVSVADDSCFQGLSTIPGNVKYYFEWDDEVSEETATASNSSTVAVKGGVGPYTWEFLSATGNNWSFGSGETNGVLNTVIPAANACGSAWIKVTDIRGGVCTGEVRCTNCGNSSWVLKTNDVCVISGDAQIRIEFLNYIQYFYIIGARRQEQITRKAGGGCCWDTEEEAFAYCVAYAVFCEDHPLCYSNDVLSCSNCIDPDNNIGPGSEGCRVYSNEDRFSYGHTCVYDLKYYEWECN